MTIIISLFAVIIYSSIDGYDISIKLKIFYGISIAVLCSFSAINRTFAVQENDDSMIYITSSINFSVLSQIAGDLRVLSIFFWRQTILLFLKKDKCINIRHSPNLKWIKN